MSKFKVKQPGFLKKNLFYFSDCQLSSQMWNSKKQNKIGLVLTCFQTFLALFHILQSENKFNKTYFSDNISINARIVL